jgi:hypothetical protein
MDLLSYPGSGGMLVLLAIVLVVSIVAGSLLMATVSLLLLAVFAGLKYRARMIGRNLDRSRDPGRPE